MVATLSTTGTAWNVSNERHYGVWDGVRQSSATGGPKGRYVANLGHVQDDESGLIYMRARYYEPGTGRFISEDRARDGKNWFTYCSSNPVNFVDRSGNSDDLVGFYAGALNRVLEFLKSAFGIEIPDVSELWLKVAAAALEIAGYEKKRELWALSASLARLASQSAAAAGNGWLALGLGIASVGLQVGCLLMRGLQAMALYGLALDIYLYYAQEGE